MEEGRGNWFHDHRRSLVLANNSSSLNIPCDWHMLYIFNQNEKSAARTVRAVVEKLRIDCVIKVHEIKAVTVDIFCRFLYPTRDNEMRTFAVICRLPFTSYHIISSEGEALVDRNEEKEVNQSPSGPAVGLHQVRPQL